MYNFVQMEKITIKDVAKRAGVSVGSVSMVLNNRKGVASKTADKVLAVVKELNYTPNKAASTLRIGFNKIIGVITPDISNIFFAEITRQIEDIAYENGFTVLFSSSDNLTSKIARLIDTFHADGVKGLMITPTDDCSKEIERAVKLGMSVVFLNRNPKGNAEAGRVHLDHNKAMRMAVDHLFANGYKHIEVFSNEAPYSNLTAREDAYMAYFRELGLGDTARVQHVNEQDEAEMMRMIQESRDRGTDAIIIPQGYLGVKVVTVVKKLGLKIPEDLALVGFDGGETFSLMTPSITQIDQSAKETAQNACAILMEMMTEGVPGRTVIIEPRLIAGESSAPKSC